MSIPFESPAIFLDRDGVIIVEKNFQADPDSIEFLPQSIKALQNSNKLYKLIIVSNQSGVARGYFTLDDVIAFNNHLDSILKNNDINITGWFFCPHGPDDSCECRKPNTGMILKAASEHGIDLEKSWMIGDKSSDIQAGMNAGLKTILVKTGYGGKEANAYEIVPDFLADNLYDAIEIIKERANR